MRDGGWGVGGGGEGPFVSALEYMASFHRLNDLI